MFRNKDDFQKICKIIGYEFKDKNLLLQALTRRSALVEGRQSREIDDFQRLEFIGDKVLNLIISDSLMDLHPSWREGQLTQETAKYVNNKGPLAAVARQLGLGDFLIMGRGEESNNQARENDKVLSDAMEALIGAIWLDSNRNYNILKNFIINHWGRLGLIPTVEYEELISIILDHKISKSKRIERFQEAFSKMVEPQTIDSIIENTIGEPELLEIVLTKSIKKIRLNDMLIESVRSGWLTQVKMLLKKDADPTAMFDGEPLLQYAVTSHLKESPQIVELLLRYNADPNWKRGKVKKPYFGSQEVSYGLIMAYFKDKTTVETIEYEDNNTALHWVMLDNNVVDAKQQLQITQSLLKYSANPNLKNEEQKTPLHIICENHIEAEAYAEIIHELVAAKADVNSQDAKGNTPLHNLLIQCARYLLVHFTRYLTNNFEILEAVKSMLTTNFNINAQNKEGNTILHLAYLWVEKSENMPAAVFFSTEIILMISAKNPNKQLKNLKGQTAEYFEKTIRINEEVINQLGFHIPVKDVINEEDEEELNPIDSNSIATKFS